MARLKVGVIGHLYSVKRAVLRRATSLASTQYKSSAKKGMKLSITHEPKGSGLAKAIID
jgi:hypothetical protein